MAAIVNYDHASQRIDRGARETTGSFRLLVSLDQSTLLGQVSEIPSFGDQVTISGVSMRVTSTSARSIDDSTYDVTVNGTTSFSDVPVPPSPEIERALSDVWEVTFQPQTVDVPIFIKRIQHEVTRSDAAGVQPRRTAIYDLSAAPQNFTNEVLAREVLIQGLSGARIREVLDVIGDANGRLHTFRGREWLFKSPGMRIERRFVPVDESGVSIGYSPNNNEALVDVYDARIRYTWLNDPGSPGPGAVQLPPPNPADPPGPLVVLAPDRPAWHRYYTIPADTVNGVPSITTGPIFGDASNLRDPDGWRTLPGTPLT